MGTLGLEEFVLNIETISPAILWNAFEKLVAKSKELEAAIPLELSKVQLQLEESIKQVVVNS